MGSPRCFRVLVVAVGVAGGLLVLAPDSVGAAERTTVAAVSQCDTLDPGSWRLAGKNPRGVQFNADLAVVCTRTADDPRVSGTETIVLDVNWVGAYYPLPPRVPFTADYLLTNADGYWGGTGVGWLEVISWDPFEVIHHSQLVAFGHGAYEGLQFRESMTEFTSIGTITAPGPT